MELTDMDRGLINDLINVAWAAGAVKNPQMAQAVETLRAKLQAKPKEQPKKEEGKTNGGK